MGREGEGKGGGVLYQDIDFGGGRRCCRYLHRWKRGVMEFLIPEGMF